MGEPVRSMTGSGSFAVEAALGRIEAEARSVNHRFLKTTIRTHGPLPNAERAAEAALRASLKRGHVTVHLRYRPGAGPGLAAWIHEDVFAAAAKRLNELAHEHGLAAVTTHDVLAVPGVLADARASGEDDPLAAPLADLVDGMVTQLQASREREGLAMAGEVEDLLDRIALAVASLVERAGEVPLAYRARLKARLDELLEGSGVAVDPAQLARECAQMAERCDVREEIARLKAHVDHARALLSAGGPVGRRLDFLAQELHREANTVASKASDLALSRTVLDLRASVERLREQVQNLE